MNVTCPNCATVYRVDPAKVPETGVRARCSVCSAVFAVRREEQAQSTPVRAAVGAAAEAPVAAAAPKAPAPAPASPAPASHAAPVSPAAPPRAPTLPPPAMPAGTRSAPPAAPAVPSAPAAPAIRPAAAAPAPPVFSPQAPAAPPAPPAAAAPRPASTPGARPVNPFLSQDPALKARRLARALISDMVVYHPAKRQEGLRDGNLKELFDEEIKKSWEEYADQVGKDVAETTPYFKEALNEILAGGRQIF
jgi:predicted Zn finger-like uncharacterized protein